MMRFAADENFDGMIVRVLLRRFSELDIVRVQDIGLSGADEPTILHWAAQEKRVLLTHDVETITFFAYERAREGLPMPGVIEISQQAPIGQVINCLLYTSRCV